MKYSYKTFKVLFLITTLTLQGNAQFEVYPSLNNWSTIDLKVLDAKTVEIHANTQLLGGRGSILNMYRFDQDLNIDRTVSLRAATNNDHVNGNYGSLRLDAFVDSRPFTNATNQGISSSYPYAMISLVKHGGPQHNTSQSYSWNMGVYNEFEFDTGLSGNTDEYDCQNCLTLAYQGGTGAAFYKYSFGSDNDFQTASDARLKENITDISESLDKILELSSKNYHYIWSDKNPDRKSTGFLAQDVQKVFPELVSSIQQPNGEKTLMLNYIGMIPHLTKGMQEQQQIIESQKELIDKLSKRLAIIELKNYN